MGAPADRIDYGIAQALPGMGPEIGSTWRNKGSGDWYTIVSIRQTRKCWVTIRGVHGEREISLQYLHEYYMPTTR